MQLINFFIIVVKELSYLGLSANEAEHSRAELIKKKE